MFEPYPQELEIFTSCHSALNRGTSEVLPSKDNGNADFLEGDKTARELALTKDSTYSFPHSVNKY